MTCLHTSMSSLWLRLAFRVTDLGRIVFFFPEEGAKGDKEYLKPPFCVEFPAETPWLHRMDGFKREEWVCWGDGQILTEPLVLHCSGKVGMWDVGGIPLVFGMKQSLICLSWVEITSAGNHHRQTLTKDAQSKTQDNSPLVKQSVLGDGSPCWSVFSVWFCQRCVACRCISGGYAPAGAPDVSAPTAGPGSLLSECERELLFQGAMWCCRWIRQLRGKPFVLMWNLCETTLTVLSLKSTVHFQLLLSSLVVCFFHKSIFRPQTVWNMWLQWSEREQCFFLNTQLEYCLEITYCVLEWNEKSFYDDLVGLVQGWGGAQFNLSDDMFSFHCSSSSPPE